MWSHKINKKKNQKRNQKQQKKNHTLEEAPVWRSTPEQSMVLALNAQNGQHPGAERPEQAWFWRSTPEMASKGR